MARVAAGNKDNVDTRQIVQHGGPVTNFVIDGLGIAVVLGHGRIPDGDIEIILVADARHLDHHLLRRDGKVRAVGEIVGDGWQQFDGVRAEDRKFTDVLVPHLDGQRIVRIGLGSVAELMAAHGVMWRTGEIHRFEIGSYRATSETEHTQHTSGTKDQAALIAAANCYPCTAAFSAGGDGIRFSRQLRGFGGDAGHRRAEAVPVGARPEIDFYGSGVVVSLHPRDATSLHDFVDDHLGGDGLAL